MAFPVPVKVQFCYRYVADGKEEKRKYKVYLNGRQEQNLTCEMIPKYCGKVEIQMRKIVCYDALGILGITKRPKEKLFDCDAESISGEPNCEQSNKMVSGGGESYAQDRGGEDSAEIYDVREYRAGDRMQKVHWKLSARENTLYIKEFSYPLGATVVLLMEEDTKGK